MAEEEIGTPPEGGTGETPKVAVKPKTKAELEAEVAELRAQLDAKQEGPPASTPVAEKDGGPDEETPIPPAWKSLVKEILGEDFKCEVSLPESGGTIFKVIVPREKSNAAQIHWTMFDRDVRSRELGNTGIKGVKDWCLRIRKNLQNSGMKLPVYP